MRSCKLRIAVCSAGLAVPQFFAVACGDWMMVHGQALFLSLQEKHSVDSILLRPYGALKPLVA